MEEDCDACAEGDEGCECWEHDCRLSRVEVVVDAGWWVDLVWVVQLCGCVWMVLDVSSRGVVNAGFYRVGCDPSFEVHLLLFPSVMLSSVVDERALFQ